MTQTDTTRTLLRFGLSFGLLVLALVVVAEGRNLLVPLAVAVLVWYLLNGLADLIGRVRPYGHPLPFGLRMAVAVVLVLLDLMALANLIGGNVAQVSAAAPSYEANMQRLLSEGALYRLLAKGAALFGLEEVPSLSDLLGKINLRSLISRLAGMLAGVASNFGVVVIYVVFLLVEQRAFEAKMQALFPDPARQAAVRRVLTRMQRDIRRYIRIATLCSLLTGGASYLILVAVGVDFAGFWALVIFLLNFIPTIGSLLGVVFPALLTLVQFDTLQPFFIVVALLGATQVFIGNVLQPRMMGRSLNISPLVVLLSLALWGSLWGIAGAFLCVPIMVIVIIVLAQFPATRGLAVILSSDGAVARVDDETGS